MENPDGITCTEIDSWPGCVGNYTVCLLVFSPALGHIVANPLGSSVARPSGDRRATELFIVCHIEGKLRGERGERSKGDCVGEVHMIPGVSGVSPSL